LWWATDTYYPSDPYFHLIFSRDALINTKLIYLKGVNSNYLTIRSCHFLQGDINIATAPCPIFGICWFADGYIKAMQSIPNIGALRKDVKADQYIAFQKKT
jgi:hypothetical protein